MMIRSNRMMVKALKRKKTRKPQPFKRLKRLERPKGRVAQHLAHLSNHAHSGD